MAAQEEMQERWAPLLPATSDVAAAAGDLFFVNHLYQVQVRGFLAHQLNQHGLASRDLECAGRTK